MRGKKARSYGWSHRLFSCEQIPELFLDKLIAKKHFSQFGRINRFILRPKRLSCTVEYESPEAAEAALARGGAFRDWKFNVYWTDEAPASSSSGRDEGFIDPEVQQELDTMSGGPSSLRIRQTMKQCEYSEGCERSEIRFYQFFCDFQRLNRF